MLTKRSYVGFDHHYNESFDDYYADTSFSEPITTPDNKLQGYWFAPKEGNPSFRWEGRNPLPFEVRYVAYSSEKAFMLFNQNDKPVSDSCDNDVSTIFSNIQQKYEYVVLSKESKGDLYIAQSNYYGVDKRPKLMFIPDGAQIPYEVGPLEVTEAIERLSLYKNKIYFLEFLPRSTPGVTLNKLKSFNPFTKKIENLRDTPPDSSLALNDFFFFDDNIFYLSGKYCLIYKSLCDNQLVVQNLNTGSSTRFVKNLKSRDIGAYDVNKETLYMHYTDGDAGCMWESIETYSFQKRLLNTLNSSISGCEGDPEPLEKPTISSEDIEIKYKDQKQYGYFISIENGELKPSNRTLPENSPYLGIQYLIPIRYFLR